jgi:tetratricopeptide (TPR) repeat protein
VQEAIAEFRQAIAADPMFAESHYNLGIAYMIQGNLDAAIAEFHEGLAIGPTHARVYHNLALVYFRKGSYQKAIEYYDRARELGYSGDPSLAQALAPHRQVQPWPLPK